MRNCLFFSDTFFSTYFQIRENDFLSTHKMVYYRNRAYRARRPYLRPSMPPRSKYSIEQKSFQANANTTTAVNSIYQDIFTIVDATTLQGMRKVKHVMCNLTLTGSSTGPDAINPLYWAIVYVPQGTNVGALNLNNSLYEPNQYVMNCGVIDPSAGPIRFSSPIARNLNSGDSIILVVGKTSASPAVYSGVFKYAITLN